MCFKQLQDLIKTTFKQCLVGVIYHRTCLSVATFFCIRLHTVLALAFAPAANYYTPQNTFNYRSKHESSALLRKRSCTLHSYRSFCTNSFTFISKRLLVV
ncbi:hypothetical protein BDFB_002654 [Asbolus verrucosus]|uniref:Uncharacterized protein n=1 Tax=Asbolus verrucosus TaxID=1661398 RepID=A0A482VE33_ASBVE|nr:hypothetical protein BDFB_002654 [Asbolus verrucosus]